MFMAASGRLLSSSVAEKLSVVQRLVDIRGAAG
jgi:hypothetical protein